MRRAPKTGSMAGMNVRQLAAVDMYGIRGTDRRRRVILVEFVADA
jgi:hypothetical protein